MTKPGLEPGARLTRADKRAIRAELLRLARTTTHRAYTLRYDGDALYEFRVWPDGKVARVRVNEKGVALEPPTRLLAGLVPTRWVGVAAAVAAVLAEVLSRAV